MNNVKSITIDQGWKFNLIFYIGYRLKIYIYKAHPYASHQKNYLKYQRIHSKIFQKSTNFKKIDDLEIWKV
ncbi:transposase [Mycoplasma synoviae GX11-T]|nr:transposase [Mycoplasmopsis synoviae GX11-T]